MEKGREEMKELERKRQEELERHFKELDEAIRQKQGGSGRRKGRGAEK